MKPGPFLMAGMATLFLALPATAADFNKGIEDV